MDRTLRVPRSRIHLGYVDQEIEEVSSTEKARPGEKLTSSATRNLGIPKHCEMGALDATGPLPTSVSRSSAAAQLPQTGHSLQAHYRRQASS
jgi:hypothetical protein